MKVFFHLLRHELREQRLFWWTSLCIGFLPILAGLLARPGDGSDLRGFLATIVTLLFFFGAMIVLGASWLTRGFGIGGRRGFELARPVSAWRLCAAKLGAVPIALLGGTLLVALPTTLVEFDRFRAWLIETGPPTFLFSPALIGHSWDRVPYSQAPWIVLGLATWPLLLLVAIALLQTLAFTIAARSRQALTTFAGIALFALVLSRTCQDLVDHDLVRTGIHWLPALFLALALLGAGSAWRSFTAGALLESAHQRYSRSLGGGLLLLSGLLFLFGHYAAPRPDVAQLETFWWAAPSSDGSRWIVVGRQAGSDSVPLFFTHPGARWATHVAQLSRVTKPFSLGRQSALIGELGPQGDFRYWFLSKTMVARPLPAICFLGGHDGWRTFGPPMQWQEILGEGQRTQLDEEGTLLVRQRSDEMLVCGLDGQEMGRIPIPVTGFNDHHHLSVLVRRHGTIFDLVVGDPTPADGETWQVDRFRLDAAIPELRPAGSWRFPRVAGAAMVEDADSLYGFTRKDKQAWWSAAVQLLDAGVPPEAFAGSWHLKVLREGNGAFLMQEPLVSGAGQWIRMDGHGNRTGVLELPESALVAGEIRPGLLLAVLADDPRFCSVDDFTVGCGLRPDFEPTTLVVDVPSGAILRRLPGFAAKADFAGSGQVWLVGAHGEPYDLDAAGAEPRRILPWRPLAAAQSGDAR